MTEPTLGDLQQLVLLAVGRLGTGAFAAAVRDDLERVAKRSVSVSTVYVTLVRLENQGLVKSFREQGDTRAGKPRRYFEVTRIAWERLRASRDALQRMWKSLEPAS